MYYATERVISRDAVLLFFPEETTKHARKQMKQMRKIAKREKARCLLTSAGSTVGVKLEKSLRMLDAFTAGENRVVRERAVRAVTTSTIAESAAHVNAIARDIVQR